MTRCAECITNDVARAFGVSVADIMGRSRLKRHVYPRMAVYRFMRLHGLSTAQIGRMVGHRDHSSVVSGIARAEHLLSSDAEFAARFEEARAA